MMKTPEQYKSAAIAAMHEIRDKYREFDLEKHSYFSPKSCSLCKIYRRDKHGLFGCDGCPMALTGFSVVIAGCALFHSYKNATDAWHDDLPTMPEAFEARAKFYDYLIELAQEKPAEAFHPETWKPWELDLNL